MNIGNDVKNLIISELKKNGVIEENKPVQKKEPSQTNIDDICISSKGVKYNRSALMKYLCQSSMMSLFVFCRKKNCRKHISLRFCIYKKTKPVVGLLGGEPTLAKDFPLIISHAKTYTGGIRLYSNLITDRSNIEYILGAKNMVLVWNVGSYLQATIKNKHLIIKNEK